MAGAYKYRPQYTQNTIGPDPAEEAMSAMDELRKLVERWRTNAEVFGKHSGSYQICADELEALIPQLERERQELGRNRD